MASYKRISREWNSEATDFFLSFVLFWGVGLETKTSSGKIRPGQEQHQAGSRRAQEGEVVTEGKITIKAPQVVGCHTLNNLEQKENEVDTVRCWCYWDSCGQTQCKCGPYKIALGSLK